ncbi:CBD9-like protein, partial [Lojkania enalia]
TKYYDLETGISYSSISHANGLTHRIAFPEDSSASDAILQVVAPNDFGWCGFSWGGHMTQNPLSVGWPTGVSSGQKAIISSRMAYGYYAVPLPYDGATYTYLVGTTSNDTHWQITTRCQGCTQWSSADGDFNLQNETEAVFAYACSSVPPDDPASNSSTFNIHEQFGIWGHDLSGAKNASFSEWVEKNSYTETQERRWSA